MGFNIKLNQILVAAFAILTDEGDAVVEDPFGSIEVLGVDVVYTREVYHELNVEGGRIMDLSHFIYTLSCHGSRSVTIIYACKCCCIEYAIYDACIPVISESL